MEEDLELDRWVRGEGFVHGNGQLSNHVVEGALRVKNEDDGAELLKRKRPLLRVELSAGEVPSLDRNKGAIAKSKCQTSAEDISRGGATDLMKSSPGALADFSMNRVSLGAMRSKTTLRMLDLPPLQKGEHEILGQHCSRRCATDSCGPESCAQDPPFVPLS